MIISLKGFSQSHLLPSMWIIDVYFKSFTSFQIFCYDVLIKVWGSIKVSYAFKSINNLIFKIKPVFQNFQNVFVVYHINRTSCVHIRKCNKINAIHFQSNAKLAIQFSKYIDNWISAHNSNLVTAIILSNLFVNWLDR